MTSLLLKLLSSRLLDNSPAVMILVFSQLFLGISTNGSNYATEEGQNVTIETIMFAAGSGMAETSTVEATALNQTVA
jgi:hypothetical protein